MDVEIPLTIGQVAIVCECHANLVTGYKWQASFDRHTKTYRAVRTYRDGLGNSKRIYMHRAIMEAVDGICVDHKDRNTLNTGARDIYHKALKTSRSVYALRRIAN